MSRGWTIALVAWTLVTSGCDPSSSAVDSGDSAVTDGSLPRDDAASTSDGGTNPDAAAPPDATSAPDASVPPTPDAGPRCPDDRSGAGPIAGPAGLMIQAHTASDLCVLERALDHVCRAHRSTTSGVIHDLVLTDAVAPDAAGRPSETIHTAVLDLVLRYAGCFDNLFIGTIPEVILADPYAHSTILDEASRWTWLYAAQRVADAVRDYMSAAAPSMAWHWYVSYEANLNYFTDAAYRSAYVALLDQHVRDLEARHAPAAVAWSPTFWTDPAALSSGARTALSAALRDLFARVPGIEWVLVQDHLGVEASFSCADALTYYSMVRAAGPALASVQINVEYFELSGSDIRAGDPGELTSRVRCYLDAGASLGASFDFRYWYPAHGH